MEYKILGSKFELPREHTKHGRQVLNLSTAALTDFWSEIDAVNPGLSQARGCYIFAVRAGGGVKPWYVGQSKGAFRNECFTSHKKSLYYEVFHKIAKGTPILMLIARCTNGGKLAKKTLPKAEADFVEKQLISLALTQNSDLANKRDTKLLRELRIPGVINSPPGKPPADVSTLRSMLGLP